MKTRAATLLATDRDPADKIFKDIGVIYGLRSKLVHGGSMIKKELLKGVRKVSTIPDNVLDREATAHVVERLRDLVRRSLLARICLASGDTPLWRLGADEGVDAIMVDDLGRNSPPVRIRYGPTRSRTSTPNTPNGHAASTRSRGSRTSSIQSPSASKRHGPTVGSPRPSSQPYGNYDAAPPT